MGSIDVRFLSVPISRLSVECKEILRLLNPEKCIHGYESGLPRDWRGIASKVGISKEEASNIELYNRDLRIIQVLSIWVEKCKDEATFGLLLKYLVEIERYDVYHDILDLASKGQLDASETNNKSFGISVTSDAELITYDDKKHGFPQKYNALVLFSQKDKSFVDELIGRMRDLGHKVCTEEDLLPIHASQHVPISLLISQRCAFIILIISPNFFESPQNKYYMEYAQAFGISNRRHNIIVCMYKHVAVLPESIMYYTKLSCNRNIFWDRLATTISNHSTPVKNRIQENVCAALPYKVEELNTSSKLSESSSSPVITELTQSSLLQSSHKSLNHKEPEQDPSIVGQNVTKTHLPPNDHEEGSSKNLLSSISDVSEKKKKSVLKLPIAIFDSIKAKVTIKKKRRKDVAVLA